MTFFNPDASSRVMRGSKILNTQNVTFRANASREAISHPITRFKPAKNKKTAHLPEDCSTLMIGATALELSTVNVKIG